MKRIAILTSFCFIIPLATAQIKIAEQAEWTVIGEVKSLGITIAKFEYNTADTDTVYF